MRLIAHETGPGRLVVGLGADEFMVLLQPGEMLRAVVERDSAWRSATGFLREPTPPPGEDDLILVALPREAGAALLAESAGHPFERMLQHLLFDALAPGERPPL